MNISDVPPNPTEFIVDGRVIFTTSDDIRIWKWEQYPGLDTLGEIIWFDGERLEISPDDEPKIRVINALELIEAVRNGTVKVAIVPSFDSIPESIRYYMDKA